jgi:hypothetical protein
MAQSRLGSMAVLSSLVITTAACDTAAEPAKAPQSATPHTSAAGDPAIWRLGEDQQLQKSSTSFTVQVACNSGITGDVLPPDVRKSSSEIVLTFSVAPQQPDPAPCPGNKEVPYTIELGEQLRGRALVDGQCLPGGEAVGTIFCEPDSIRFKP